MNEQNQQYIDVVNGDIIARVKAALEEYGPSPAEIAAAVGADVEDVGEFIRLHPELKQLYIEKVNAIVTVIKANRGLRGKVAKLFGVDRRVLKIWESKNPKIQQAFDDAHEDPIDLAEEKLFDRLELGDWDAIKLVLLTKGKDRGYSQSPKSTLEKEAERLGIPVNALRDKLAERLVAQIESGESNDQPGKAAPAA